MWINKNVKEAINNRKKAFKLLKQTSGEEALKSYKKKN